MGMSDIISERRKAKGMTQKQLAEKLGVTDKAVSKWERGNGCPDIGYLEPLAEALDISVSELLKGKANSPDQEPVDHEEREEIMIKNTLDYASRVYKGRSLNLPRIAMICIFVLGFVGILATSIVDLAMNGGFTWSLLPIGAILFLWLCITPLFVLKKRRVDASLLCASVFVFPFLYMICRVAGGDWFASVAVPLCAASVVVVWVIRGIFATGLSIWNQLAISVLIGAIANIVISDMTGRILHDGGFDVWNLIGVAILAIIAGILVFIGRMRKANSSDT